MEFEWDLSKETQNLLKHGIAFSKAVECFYDPHGILLEDSKHSGSEKRLYWIGTTTAGRVLTTRFTRRNGKIRIIGCAEWRKFRRMYHETAQNQ